MNGELKNKLTIEEKPKNPSFNEAFWFWLKLGFISFGGPAGQIAIMHEFLVEKKKWISESRFLHALNFTMILPGPEAQQLATYTGWLMHGVKGGLFAGLFFILPSMFILLGLSTLYVLYGNVPWVYALFDGLKPAVIAIVILALFKIGKKSLKSLFHVVIALAAFVAIFFFNVSFPLIILVSLIFAFMGRKLLPNLFSKSDVANQKIPENEKEYFINEFSPPADAGFTWMGVLNKTLVALVIATIPIALFYSFSSDFNFWKDLSWFFTKAAFVTFGGAYAVLPYVAQVSVEQFQWLSQAQMIDGLALGETTPGPLVMVLVFVGYMAGFNHFDSSVMMGAVGLVTTTIFTFIPCFLFIFIGAPLIEKTRSNELIKQMLHVVTAAVVGVILNLTVYLGKVVVFPKEIVMTEIDYFALSWIIVSFIALFKFKINMILWIGISGLVGLTKYLLS